MFGIQERASDSHGQASLSRHEHMLIEFQTLARISLGDGIKVFVTLVKYI